MKTNLALLVIAVVSRGMSLAEGIDVTLNAPFKLDITSGGYAQLSFDSEDGVIYQLEYSADDMQTWSKFGAAIPGTSQKVTRDVGLFGQRGFWRLNNQGLMADVPVMDCQLAWQSSSLTTTATIVTQHALKIAASGTRYAAYIDDTRKKLCLATIANSVVTREDVADANSSQTDILLDLLPDGSPAIAFFGAAPNYLLNIARKQAGTWSIETPVYNGSNISAASGPLSFFSLAEPLRFFLVNSGGTKLLTRNGTGWLQQAAAPVNSGYLSSLLLADGSIALCVANNSTYLSVYRSPLWEQEFIQTNAENETTLRDAKLWQLPNGHLTASIVTQNTGVPSFTLRFIEKLSTGWAGEVVYRDLSGINSHSLGANAKGTPVICYSAGYGLCYAVRGSSRWTKEIVDEPPSARLASEFGQESSLALDPIGGRPVMVYRGTPDPYTLRMTVGNPP